MRILVIASTPVYMSPSPKNSNYVKALKKADLHVPSFDIENESLYLKAAGGYVKRAKDLFQGSFQKIVKSIEDARSQGIKVDFMLMTARYGIVPEDELLLPYNVKLTGKPKKFIKDLSERLKTKELVKEFLRASPDICILVANKSDLLLVHDPRKGFDLTEMSSKLVVITAPSVTKQFKGMSEFIGIKQVGERAGKLASYLDGITAKTLKDYP
jgi:hypothetical protein